MAHPLYRLLALDEARFAGDAVAIVVATSPHAAADARDLVAVDYQPLPSVTDADAAAEPSAPAVWPEDAPDNVSFVYQLGGRAATDAAFARAHHVSPGDAVVIVSSRRQLSLDFWRFIVPFGQSADNRSRRLLWSRSNAVVGFAHPAADPRADPSLGTA